MKGLALVASALLLLEACGSATGGQSSRGSAEASADLPRLTGRVVDQADLLPDLAERELTTKLEELEAKTTDQLVVVTLTDLKGKGIDEWGRRLGNGWGIGQKNKNNGVLLIVAPNERQVRIEVGLGLEKAIPDQLAAEIIQQKILPQLKAGQMPEGISEGADALIERLVQSSMKKAA